MRDDVSEFPPRAVKFAAAGARLVPPTLAGEEVEEASPGARLVATDADADLIENGIFSTVRLKGWIMQGVRSNCDCLSKKGYVEYIMQTHGRALENAECAKRLQAHELRLSSFFCRPRHSRKRFVNKAARRSHGAMLLQYTS